MENQNTELPSNVVSQVVESAVALVRAELNLFWLRILSAGNRSIVAAGLTIIAMNLTPIAVLILALSPVLAAHAPGGLVLASVAPVTVLAVLAWIFSIKSWHNVFQNKPQRTRVGNGARFDAPREVSQRR